MIFAENEKELDTFIQEITIYNLNIGMKYGIEKCVMLMIKKSKEK